jgi:glycosyltransferase involved in cell wall biosynthesis
MTTPKLSILIPSIPSRVVKRMIPLYNKLLSQAEKLVNPKDVEILCFIDNKTRSIGYKRESLVYISRGDFVAFVDDDDDIEDIYVEKAIDAITNNPDVDVITFKEKVFLNDQGPYHLTFQLGYPKNDSVLEKDAKRPPWHSCFWKRKLAQKYHFPNLMIEEDWAWCSQLNAAAKTSYHIDEFMKIYRWNENTTESYTERESSLI